MRILREDYAKDEIQQRISDTRTLITTLQDSLSILQSMAMESDLPKDKKDNIRISARAFEIDVEDMLEAFDLDFDDIFVEDEEEEEDFEEDFEEEEL